MSQTSHYVIRFIAFSFSVLIALTQHAGAAPQPLASPSGSDAAEPGQSAAALVVLRAMVNTNGPSTASRAMWMNSIVSVDYGNPGLNFRIQQNFIRESIVAANNAVPGEQAFIRASLLSKLTELATEHQIDFRAYDQFQQFAVVMVELSVALRVNADDDEIAIALSKSLMTSFRPSHPLNNTPELVAFIETPNDFQSSLRYTMKIAEHAVAQGVRGL